MTITKIQATRIHGEIKPELAIVSSLGEHIRGQYVLVRIDDDSGHFGLGEASVTSVWSGETQTGTIALVEEVLDPLIRSTDPFDVEWIVHQMDRAVYDNSFAKAAIEMALLDLQGKLLNIPVYQLLGGKNPNDIKHGIRLKFVVGAVEPKLAAERAAHMVAQGWKSIKVKVGKDAHPQIDADRIEAVRKAIGDDIWLSVDANGGYTPDQAIWAAKRFEKHNVVLFEQPTRRGDHCAMANVRRKIGIPVMADESVFTAADVIDIIREDAADVLSLYPGKHGGVRATQQLAKIAEAAGIPCTIGSNLEREVATAAMAHVTVATHNLQCERFPGDLIGPVYYETALTEQALRYEADRLFVPAGVGLGVGIVEINKH